MAGASKVKKKKIQQPQKPAGQKQTDSLSWRLDGVRSVATGQFTPALKVLRFASSLLLENCSCQTSALTGSIKKS